MSWAIVLALLSVAIRNGEAVTCITKLVGQYSTPNDAPIRADTEELCKSLFDDFAAIAIAYDYNAVAKQCHVHQYTLVELESKRIADTAWVQFVKKDCPTCSQPTIPNNAIISPVKSTYDVGETVTYSCNSGYTLGGGPTITCQDQQGTGTWSTPMSTVGCTNINECQSSNHGCHICIDSVGSFTCSCNPGFELNPDQKTCRDLATTCPVLTAPSGGSVSGTNNFGDVATYTCNAGSVLQGDTQRTCQSDKTWSGAAPTCKATGCQQPLQLPANTLVLTVDEFSGMTLVGYGCKQGYKSTGNDNQGSFICSSGSWAHPIKLACEDVNECSTTQHGCAQKCDNTAGSFTCSCNVGSQLNSDGKTCTIVGTSDTCFDVGAGGQETGYADQIFDNVNDCKSYCLRTPGCTAVEFSVATKKCRSVTATPTNSGTADGSWTEFVKKGTGCVSSCTDPGTPPKSVKTGTSYNIGDSVTYSCANNYQLSGSAASKLTCTYDGTTVQWSATAPTCTFKACPAYPVPANGAMLEETKTDNVVSVVVFQCDSGYILDLPSGISCNDGAWSTPAPLCRAGLTTVCGRPTIPVNGLISGTSGSGSSAAITYGCRDGYTLQGEAVSSCSGNQWTLANSQLLPTCLKKSCGAPTSIPQHSTLIGTDYTFEAQVRIQCDARYELVGNPYSTCQADGTWSTFPTCKVIQCVVPDTVDNAVRYGTDYRLGDTVAYLCNSDYELNGAGILTCSANGVWEPATPTCTLSSCPAPTVANGKVTGTLTIGSTVTITCNTGYIIQGSATLKCQSGKTWDQPIPTCQEDPAYCPAVTLTNGAVTGTRGYTHTIKYTCDTRFKLNPDTTTQSTCQENKSWSPVTPTCVATHCELLTLTTNLKLKTGSASTTAVGNSVTFECESGFSVNGIATIQCASTGIWSNAVPTCKPNTCTAPAAPANGKLTSKTTEYSVAEKATFECNTGFRLSDSTDRICQSDGTWNLVAPTCAIVTCPALSVVSNGAVTLSKGVQYSSVAAFTCNPGYKVNTAYTSITCSVTGAWSAAPIPACIPVTCPAPRNPDNGRMTTAGITFAVQATASFICNEGYTVVGSDTITCLDTGLWNSAPPTCQAVTCSALGNPQFGAASSTAQSPYKAEVTFTCNPNYILVGVSKVTCQSTGTWSSAAPTCKEVTCTALLAPNQGSVSPTDATFKVGGEVTFSCTNGYKLSDSNVRKCLSTGQWDSASPTCIAVTCSTPVAPAHGTVSSTNNAFNTQITYTCIMTGQTVIATCNNQGVWTQSAPSCPEVTCQPPNDPANGKMTSIGTSFSIGATASFSCNPGYKLSSTTAVTCLPNRTWSPTPLPTCQVVTCSTPTNPQYGTVSSTVNAFGTTITYTCDLNGRTTIATCQADGSWSNSAPTDCPQYACKEPTVVNGFQSLTSSTTQYYSVYGYVGFKCNDGFTLSGSQYAFCMPNGTWSPTPPTCTGSGCGMALEPANGAYSVTPSTQSSTLITGSIVTFTCNAGFTLSGSASRMCLPDGTLSGTEATCVAATASNPTTTQTCTVPATPSDSVSSYSGGSQVSVNTAIFYTCNSASILTAGSSTRTCQSDGTWSGTTPTCTVVTVSGEGVACSAETRRYYGDTTTSCIFYRCVNGRTMKENCGPGTMWSNDHRVCVNGQCGNI